MATHRVRIGPLPAWVDRERLLGPGAWSWEGAYGEAALERLQAADVAARTRNLGLDGHALVTEVWPPLPRPAVRAARTEEARRMRDTTPGFLRRGCRLDEEGHRSLTPEALATRLGQAARDLVGPAGAVVEACSGAGGNSLGFARAGLTVTAVELDGARLADARHNAGVYGLTDRIRFVQGDAAALLPELPGDLVFADPPWAEARDRHRVEAEQWPLLQRIVEAAADRPLWLKLPPSFATETLPDFVPEAWFGEAAGDRQRVKFLLLRRDSVAPA